MNAAEPMTADAVEREVLAFLERERPLPAGSVDEKLDYPFLAAGVISSIGLVELVMHLEQAHGVRLAPEDLQGPDFQTARGIARIVLRGRS